MRKHSLALFALALVGLSGCGLLFAEVEIPEICVTTAPTQLDGITQANLITSIPVDLGSDISQLNDPNATIDLRLLSLSIAATNMLQLPPSALGGVNTLVIKVIDASATNTPLPTTPIARYQRDSAVAAPNVVSATATESVNLEPYLMNGKIEIEAAATVVPGGQLPAAPWDASVKACFYLKARYDYGPKVIDLIRGKK